VTTQKKLSRRKFEFFCERVLANFVLFDTNLSCCELEQKSFGKEAKISGYIIPCVSSTKSMLTRFGCRDALLRRYGRLRITVVNQVIP
jgi:hypothetical protein